MFFDKKFFNNFITYFFLTFPISLFAGNAIGNLFFLTLTILLIVNFFLIKPNIKLNLYEKILLIMFFYIVLANVLLNNYYGSLRIFKYGLYITIFILIPRIINFKAINLKLCLNIFTVFIFFLVIDSLIQYFIGHNLFGFPKIENRLTSIFFDEPVIGTYLSYYSALVFLNFSNFFKNKKKIINKNTIFLFLSLIGFITIALTGERMATIIFLLNIIIIIFLYKFEIKKIILTFIILLISVVFLFPKNLFEDRFLRGLSDIFYFDSIKKYSTINVNHKTLKEGFESSFCSYKNYGYIYYTDRLSIKNLKYTYSIDEDFVKCRKRVNKYINDEKLKFKVNQELGFFASPIGRIFNSSIIIIQDNSLIGVGIKNYRIKCNNYKSIYPHINCSTHPHNIYLELVTETGLIGLFLFLLFLFSFSKNIFKINFDKNEFLINTLLISQLSCFIVLFWPIKTSGSFFASFNSSFIWFNLILLNSLMLNYQKK